VLAHRQVIRSCSCAHWEFSRGTAVCLIVCCMLRREMTDKHRRLAEITEMIHTASLVHDDVLDECSIRRGACPLVSTALPHPHPALPHHRS
jgi:hypothetical protein